MHAGGEFVKEYLDATVPELAFGEYWDTCEYTDGVLNYNQDAHRQRTVNWCDRTGGTSAAFDFTTKGARRARVPVLASTARRSSCVNLGTERLHATPCLTSSPSPEWRGRRPSTP
jgi:hypothetical protein